MFECHSTILGFLTFCCGRVAVTHRHPFDQPEAEQELAEGLSCGILWHEIWHVFIGEYVNVVVISALMTCLFLGVGLPHLIWICPLSPVFWF